MSFFRKLFRADEPAPARDDAGATPAPPPADDPPPAGAAPAPAPADAPPPADAPQAEPAAPAEASWWASSAAPDDDPAPAPAPEPAELPEPAEPAAAGDAGDDETPTAPFSALTAEQARSHLAGAEPRDEAITPPEGTPVIRADEAESTRQLSAGSAPAISARRSTQGLAAMAVRDIGRVREVNQDSVFAMLTTLPRAGGDVTIGLFIVADGMGGHQGGEVASRLAVRTVVYHVLSQLVMPALDESMTEALQPLMISAVQAANEAIWDSAQVLGTDMGTTCTAALMVGHGLYIAHVGDSRAYLYEPGGLRPLTSDHSTVGRLIQLGQLDASEAREHPLRNQLYRTVGQQPQVMVDFIYQPVGQASHLLICSDGLWGLLDEPLMEQAITRSPWPQDACEELIALANLAGGDDNISAVVVALPMTTER